MDEPIAHIAALLYERNSIDASIAKVIGRPLTAGHLGRGQWIASQIFGIPLEESAVNQGFDGRFRSSALEGCTVNIKGYMKRAGLLDTTEFPDLDYFLVLTGPPAPAGASRGISPPWCIQAVFLFDARDVYAAQPARGVRSGIASSVITKHWDAAEIYPQARSHLLTATLEQVRMLQMFSPGPGAGQSAIRNRQHRGDPLDRRHGAGTAHGRPVPNTGRPRDADELAALASETFPTPAISQLMDALQRQIRMGQSRSRFEVAGLRLRPPNNKSRHAGKDSLPIWLVVVSRQTVRHRELRMRR